MPAKNTGDAGDHRNMKKSCCMQDCGSGYEEIKNKKTNQEQSECVSTAAVFSMTNGSADSSGTYTSTCD